MKEFSVGILWVPFDHGVKLINGRPGARFGPKAIRKELSRLIAEKLDPAIKSLDDERRETCQIVIPRLDRGIQKIQKNKILPLTETFPNLEMIDYGFVTPVKENVPKTHARVTLAVRKILKSRAIPIVVGGGHDISFASGKALFAHYTKIGQINLDAHYDVRPVVDGKITSGTPFFRLLESGILKGRNFVELGAHAPKNLAEHYSYLIKKHATVLKLEEINKKGLEKSLERAFSIAGKETKSIAFDIDIDGIQKRFAPGCSAPVVEGFTKKQALEAAYCAGANKHVGLFNLMEVNPLYDVNNKTVMLAAELILSFIKGVDRRS